MWDQVSLGALGAIVLVDTSRIAQSFGPIDYFESRGIPFLVAINEFAHAPRGSEGDIRAALALDPSVPITSVDARDRESVKGCLIHLVDHLTGLVLRAGGERRVRRRDFDF